MKLGRAELLKLRGPLALCIALAATGAAGVWLVLKEKQQAARMLVAAEAQRKQNETRLLQVRSEEQEIKQKASRFLQLGARGILGSENRLDWIEQLRDLRDRQKLAEVEYEIAPQQKLDTTPDGHEFQSSNMRIELRLLHEEDLLRFLDALQKEARALVLPRECALNRQAAGSAPHNGPAAQLKADCQLQWITIRSPEKKP